jgi:hypothetical protein
VTYKEVQPSASDQSTPTEPSSAGDDAPAPGAATENVGQPKKAGRPQRTTDADKRAQTQKEKALVDGICEQYDKAKMEAGGKKLGPRALEKIISNCKSEHNLFCIIPEDTIRTRYKRGNLSNVQRGHKSPVQSTEALIVEVVKKSNRAGNPLDREGVINFANSLIKGGPLEERVAEFKKKNVSAYSTRDHGEICGVNEVGDGWYNGFRKRWDCELASGAEINYDQRRTDWTTEYRKDTLTFEKALDIRDTKEESEWSSEQYKFMIQFKRLRMLQDHVRTLELTNGSNDRNKKQPSRLRLPAIPSLLARRKAMWVRYKNIQIQTGMLLLKAMMKMAAALMVTTMVVAFRVTKVAPVVAFRVTKVASMVTTTVVAPHITKVASAVAFPVPTKVASMVTMVAASQVPTKVAPVVASPVPTKAAMKRRATTRVS